MSASLPAGLSVAELLGVEYAAGLPGVTAAQADLLVELRCIEPATVAQLADASGWTVAQVRGRLRALEAKGLIESERAARIPSVIGSSARGATWVGVWKIRGAS